MAGIYGNLLKNSEEKEIYKNFYNAGVPDRIQEEIKFGKFRFGRSVLNKFQEDRFLFENEEFIICFEGINYSAIKTPEDFIKNYRKKGKNFVSDLKGSFSGFIFSKSSQEIILFNDFLSTRVLYYYFDPEMGFAFSSEMHVLSRMLRNSGISLSYDYDGIYAVALYGQSFYDFTTVKEIKRMDYGSVLSFDLSGNTLKQEAYYRFQREENQVDLSEFIDEMDRLFLNAIEEEWEKDRSYNYSHFGLISGGMDSRVNMMLAKSLGFEKIHSYTYGDPNSSDIKIAQQIASDNFSSHLQFNLYNGKFFTENILENYVKPTDGLTYFTANAVIYNAFKPLDFSGFGLVHSGQLGDTATGSFTEAGFNFEANLDKIGITGFVKQKHLLPKLSFLKKIVEQYNHTDKDLFTFEQRQINGTLMGDKIFSNFIDIASPFYDREFVDLMLSLPAKYKLNQRIYFEWLKVKHPQILNYKWDKIGLKPNSNFNMKYGRILKRYTNGGRKYLGLPYDSMSPVNIWLQRDPVILQEFDILFEETISLIQDNELKKDLREIYNDDTFEFRNRFSVLTALLGIKMHFYE